MSYSGEIEEDALAKDLRSKNATKVCTIDVKPCTPHEGRRIDGTCNNFKYPSKGSAKGPYLRLLKVDYGNDNKDIRKDQNNKDLPSARRVRTALQTDGRVEDKHSLTIAAYHYLEFIHLDVSALNGPRDYLQRRQYCCEPEGQLDPRCKPIPVPADDPYLRVTDIRCLNFSRAETFQDAGCVPEIIPPEQINFQTPLIDLSTVYGVDEKALDYVREYDHGLLRLERRGDRYVPFNISRDGNITRTVNNVTLESRDEVSMLTMAVTNITNNDICLQNERNETVCYKFGFAEVGNFDLRTTTLTIFFMREHNRIAKELRHLNPCWKDDRLFKVARQINIATAQNIFLYELLPLFLGYENMIHYNLISDRVERLSPYYEDEVPLVYSEFEIAVRRYNEKYNLIGEFSVSETLFGQGLIETARNFEEINRGTFYQRAAKSDDIIDPEISEKYYGNLQRAHDLSSIDIQRGRDLGVRGYNDYSHLCGMKPAKKFEDFSDIMDVEKILALKDLYEKIEDVDLLAGIISEHDIKGGFVGPTLFCIMAKQIQLWRFSDRFWFERGDQMHSLTLRQLHEIRRANIARLVCDNAEGIKHIQPQAFLNVGHGNSHVPCTHIPGPDLTKWKDSSCYKNRDEGRRERLKDENDPINHKETGRHDPQNMISDYTSFFNSLLSYNPTEVAKNEE
ncbi:peroxidase-like [Pectinophora gossypiella]|uniref:peroxidase-like n=1 Tax=Pectinophora gossypiella TaxID=13191 RepID=UPI00214E0E89|nr:peroxidase-like [Pectinophora gossypiella]